MGHFSLGELYCFHRDFKIFFHFINTFFLVCFVLKTIFYHLMNCVFIFTLLNISKFNFCFCFSFLQYFNLFFFFFFQKGTYYKFLFQFNLLRFKKNIIFICKQYANNQQFGKLLCLECRSMLLKMSKGDKNKTLQKNLIYIYFDVIFHGPSDYLYDWWHIHTWNMKNLVSPQV